MNNQTFECPAEVIQCSSVGILFGPKTGQNVLVELLAGEALKITGYTVTGSIKIYEIDKDSGIDCANCGTGLKIAYSPCGFQSEVSSSTPVRYVVGPANFQLESSAPAGVQYVKYKKIKASEVTQAMICPPVIVGACVDSSWNSTGETRCIGTNIEQREESNCGNVRWTVIGTVTWQDTGETRCIGNNVEKEQVNDCGKTQWVANGTVTWVDTGDTRCSGNNVEKEQINDCGKTKWIVDRAVAWVATGETRCNNNLIENQEVNDCGATRWTATTTACGYCASVRLFCDGSAGFGFHTNDVKDPAATVLLSSCDGSTDDCYIYPTAGLGHTLRMDNCDGSIVGYAVNKSNCAPDCGC